jgi:osmoprotectant transport system permease protein
VEQLAAGVRYLVNNPGLVLTLTWQTVWVSLAALAVAAAIGLPLGVLIFRAPALRRPVLGLMTVIYTIPSLALLVLLLPLTRLGPQTAIVALAAYAQVVLVRNTLLGLSSIDPAVIEAARGLGMTSAQRLWRVELPLALPLILAGLRIAALSTIGIGAVAALVSAGGLGTLLFQGVTTGQRAKIVAGTIALAALALLVNLLLRALERAADAPLRREG